MPAAPAAPPHLFLAQGPTVPYLVTHFCNPDSPTQPSQLSALCKLPSKISTESDSSRGHHPLSSEFQHLLAISPCSWVTFPNQGSAVIPCSAPSGGGTVAITVCETLQIWWPFSLVPFCLLALDVFSLAASSLHAPSLGVTMHTSSQSQVTFPSSHQVKPEPHSVYVVCFVYVTVTIHNYLICL